MDEEQFVTAMLANLPPIPAYYRHMAPLNRKGPVAPRFEPVAVLDAADLDRCHRGARRGWSTCAIGARFAAEHLRGTLNLELGTNLTTYLGWIVPWESQLVLLAEHEAEIAEARRLIACIGREELLAAALWPESLPTTLRRRRSRAATAWPASRTWRPHGPAGRTHELHIIDVRHPHEWARRPLGRRASTCPLQELVACRAEVPTTGQIWVHCGAGFRAAAAASLLSGWGVSPVLIDDTWQHAVETGLPITTSSMTPN